LKKTPKQTETRRLSLIPAPQQEKGPFNFYPTVSPAAETNRALDVSALGVPVCQHGNVSLKILRRWSPIPAHLLSPKEQIPVNLK
jgi:hypothetical protein